MALAGGASGFHVFEALVFQLTRFSKACVLPWVVVDAHEILQQSPKVQGLRHSKVRPEKLENLETAWFFLIAPYCPQFGPQNVGTCHYHVTISNHVKVSC